ncbi:hypothetical protein GVY41_12310 [Frigidibacter albus]|uniref:Uncharacterized protein n=1 Tax=Frigidibacter albus TaxID=1465486 RepID=A0A6L8VI98_9RHOB|nr:hypothetical protein [Frigidibacter albus]MZQ89844.1 hypothetical protein [Frigidibacter albus]NBE31781.1 hypothetical protein [Frigidibacter albus]GGH56378.1 hypothetical protein GCM10011341_24790 [Frigidibacter albus]
MTDPSKEARRKIPLALIACLLAAAVILYACSWKGEGTDAPEVTTEGLAAPDGQAGEGEPTRPAVQDQVPGG